MHIDDSDVSFYIRLTPRRANLRRLNHCAIVFRSCLKIPVQCRIDPITVLCYGNLTVVGCHSLCDSTEICNGIVVDTNPVCNIAAGHTFDVKVVAVGKRGYKYGYFRFPLRVMSSHSHSDFPA